MFSIWYVEAGDRMPRHPLPIVRWKDVEIEINLCGQCETHIFRLSVLHSINIVDDLRSNMVGLGLIGLKRPSYDTCISIFTIIDSDNGLSPSRRQAIIWTNAEIL